MKPMIHSRLAFLAAVSFHMIVSPTPARADAVTDWNLTAASASLAAGLSTPEGSVDPLHESRIFAMMHAAIHDALNAIDPRFEPYASEAQAPADASPEAAVAAAAHDVLIVLFGQIPDPPFPPAVASMALIEAAYDAALASIPDASARMKGIQAGQQAAAAILALRAGDGAAAPFLDFNYVPGSNPGDFQFIPGFPFAAGTGWGEVTPFVLNFSSQYHVQPPSRLTSKKYAADFNEVKSLGAANSTSRTAEQTEIALFWVES